MKTITLTPAEFYSFKQLANFFFDLTFKSGWVFITADADQLEKLGY